MNGAEGVPPALHLIRMDEIGKRERYHLLTSLLVPRPIGWISSRSAAGLKNLAPFSFFAALATTPALIGISSIHLLKTFIELGAKPVPDNAVMWQVVLHMTFVFSALLLAWTDRISTKTAAEARAAH